MGLVPQGYPHRKHGFRRRRAWAGGGRAGSSIARSRRGRRGTGPGHIPQPLGSVEAVHDLNRQRPDPIGAVADDDLALRPVEAAPHGPALQAEANSGGPGSMSL